MLALSILLLLPPPILSWNVLFMNVFAGGSHQTISAHLSNVLVRHGHQVTYLSANIPKSLDERVVKLEVKDLEAKGNSFLTDMTKPNGTLINAFKTVSTLLNLCADFLAEPAVKELRRNGKGKFDIGVVFGLPILDECVLALFHELDVNTTAYYFPAPAAFPKIRSNLGIVTNFATFDLQMGIAFGRNFGSDPNATIMDRARSVFYDHLGHLIESLVRLAYQPDLSSFKDYPGFTALQRQVDLVFIHTHMVADYPTVLPPGVVPMGGLPCTPYDDTQITGELREFVGRGEFVLFVLGSHVKYLPSDVEEMLVKAFSRLPFNVIWRTTSKLSGLPGNIRTFSWLPQQSLLQHPNIRVFITHGGYSSKIEGMCAGVPMLVAPQFAPDQYKHAIEFVERGIGLAIEKLGESNEDEVFEKIMEVSGPEYKREIAAISRQILATRLTEEQVLGYIDIVMSGHRLLPGYQPWYQYLYLDIILTPIITIYLIRLAVKWVRG